MYITFATFARILCVIHQQLPLTTPLLLHLVSGTQHGHIYSTSLSTISRQNHKAITVCQGALVPHGLKLKILGRLWAQTQIWANDHYPFLGPLHTPLFDLWAPGIALLRTISVPLLLISGNFGNFFPKDSVLVSFLRLTYCNYL